MLLPSDCILVSFLRYGFEIQKRTPLFVFEHTVIAKLGWYSRPSKNSRPALIFRSSIPQTFNQYCLGSNFFALGLCASLMGIVIDVFSDFHPSCLNPFATTVIHNWVSSSIPRLLPPFQGSPFRAVIYDEMIRTAPRGFSNGIKWFSLTSQAKLRSLKAGNLKARFQFHQGTCRNNLQNLGTIHRGRLPAELRRSAA